MKGYNSDSLSEKGLAVGVGGASRSRGQGSVDDRVTSMFGKGKVLRSQTSRGRHTGWQGKRGGGRGLWWW